VTLRDAGDGQDGDCRRFVENSEVSEREHESVVTRLGAGPPEPNRGL